MPAVPARFVFLAGVAAVVVMAQDLVEDAEAPQYQKRPQQHDGDHGPKAYGASAFGRLAGWAGGGTAAE